MTSGRPSRSAIVRATRINRWTDRALRWFVAGHLRQRVVGGPPQGAGSNGSRAAQLGVGSAAVALERDRPGSRYAIADNGALFRHARAEELSRRHAGHLDLHVHSVTQRPAHASNVALRVAGPAAAVPRWVVGVAAATRVHRRDKLEARRVPDMAVGTGDDQHALLERLPQRVKGRRDRTRRARPGRGRRGEQGLPRREAAAGRHRRARRTTPCGAAPEMGAVAAGRRRAAAPPRSR